jgi:hypothetical protein
VDYAECMQPLRAILFLTVAVLSIALPLSAQAQPNDDELNFKRAHIKWPSPSSIVNDLQSPNSDIRLKALLLLGVPETAAHILTWSNNSTPVVTGSEVVRPEQIQLRYAALGTNDTQQAIIVVQVLGTYAFAAAGTPGANGWERIAAFGCWCKYDADSAVDEFVSFVQAPGSPAHYELVVRASGGGTGLYVQNEFHFRLYRRELKSVMSFVRRLQRVSMGPPAPSRLTLERRWFAGGVLVEGRSESAMPPGFNFRIRELQERSLRGLICRTFQWNNQNFRYDPVARPDPCEADPK